MKGLSFTGFMIGAALCIGFFALSFLVPAGLTVTGTTGETAQAREIIQAFFLFCAAISLFVGAFAKGN